MSEGGKHGILRHSGQTLRIPFPEGDDAMKASRAVLCAAGLLVAASGFWPKLAALPAANLQPETPVLVLDAGHGGFDGGAVANGLVEKDVNLAITQKLAEFCAFCGVETVLVRETDTDVGDPTLDASARKRDDILTRLSLFEETPGALVLSIHQNKYDSPSAFGAQMFYGVGNPQSPVFAQALQQRFWALDPANDRQVKEGPDSVYLLQHATCPMVLAECGFLSNPEEAQKLSSPEYQQKVAFTLLCGVCDGWNAKENQNLET